MKTADLTDRALDWAVAKCEGTIGAYRDPHTHFGEKSSYITDWNLAGPIIERESLCISTSLEGDWMAFFYCHDTVDMQWIEHGPTPLIAAMRCYVASKLGDEVELPEALL